MLGISKIHGIGVFALRDIQKGSRCYLTPQIEPRFYTLTFSDLKQLFPEIRELILWRWASVVNGSVFQSPNDDAGLLFFCNHSNEPNYDVVSDIALRNIKKGEEVLEDYSAMKNWQLAYPDLIKWNNVSQNAEIQSKENLPIVRCVSRRIKSWFKS